MPQMSLPLSNAEIAQTVLSRTFFMCPFHMSFHKFDWAESARLADLQVLINQVVFAECVSKQSLLSV